MTVIPNLRKRLEIEREIANLEGLLSASFTKIRGSGREEFHGQLYAALVTLEWTLGCTVAPSDPLALVEGGEIRRTPEPNLVAPSNTESGR